MILTLVFLLLGILSFWWLFKVFTLQKKPLKINQPSRLAPEEFKNFEWEPHESDTTIYMTEETMQEFESLLKGSNDVRKTVVGDGKS